VATTSNGLKGRLPSGLRRRLGKVRRRIAGVPVAPVTGTTAASIPAAPKAPGIPVGRSLPTAERLEFRRARVFETASPEGTILEIGAAHNGTFPKRLGYHTSIVDHLDRDGLVEKYSGFAHYSADDIEVVDYVLSDGVSLTEAIPDRFDLVYASHVVEHSTSLIHFLEECTELLAPGGVLSLVVPDKRYTFDRFRERASLGRVIDTFVSRPTVHTLGTLTEFGINAVKHRGTTSWVAGHRGEYTLVNTLERAEEIAASASSGHYVDVHNWVFSPHHMRLLLHDLAELGYISVREAYFHETVGHEFFLNLTRESTGSGLTREELVVLADHELTSMEIPVFEQPT
jgi:predicted SAM-dependent methyltransferase